MRIVQIAPLEEPVPPVGYGGTELVIYNLTEEMVKRGHEVYLLAAGDSKTSAHLVPIAPLSLRQAYPPDQIEQWRNYLKIYYLAEVLKQIRDIQPDIVYNHQAWRMIPFAEFIDCPMYSTMHGPLSSNHERYTYAHFPKANYVSISNHQRLAMPELNWVKTIYNGIDLQRFPVGPADKRDYFAFLGRCSPEKGLKEIIQVIKKTNHKLKIAAKIDTVDKAYYTTEIKPYIDGKQIEFIGEIGPDQKSEFLSHAKALLLWLNWEEPFGLVVTEAMACGTPVIVNPRGAMPELIVSGKTGYLVKTLSEMQKRLDDVTKISHQDCRTHVEKHFSAPQMAKEYLALAGKER